MFCCKTFLICCFIIHRIYHFLNIRAAYFSFNLIVFTYIFSAQSDIYNFHQSSHSQLELLMSVYPGMTKCMHRTAPHRAIPHSVKYSSALTEITEHYRACFRLLPSFSTSLVVDETRIINFF